MNRTCICIGYNIYIYIYVYIYIYNIPMKNTTIGAPLLPGCRWPLHSYSQRRPESIPQSRTLWRCNPLTPTLGTLAAWVLPDFAWVISHVPMFHITQPLGIWSIMATIRWCPIAPKMDIYQSLFVRGFWENRAMKNRDSSCFQNMVSQHILWKHGDENMI